MDSTPAEELLIGRKTELTRILKMFEAASAGQGHMVLLTGEPGIGKTRLGREVLARAGRLGARVCLGRSFEQHMAVPFFLFTEALTLPLAGPPLLPDTAALERWPELRRLLPESGVERPIRDARENETQLQVFRAVTAFMRAAAEVSPLVALFDDLHWADVTSLSLLLYLARHLAGTCILILGNYRDTEMDREHPLAETLRELIRERLADEVTLHRLAAPETAELVRAQLGGASVSDELVTLVHGRAEGNPFFTEELIKALVEQGAVSQANGKWQAAAVDGIEVPHGVRSVVDQRVRRLAGDVQELLRLASVFGQEFELDALLAVSGQTEPVVLGELEAALAAGLLEEQAGVGVERYRFAHALIHQTLYEELPGHRRRRLHRRVAEALERLGGTQRGSLAADLSRHFFAAGDEDRALSFTIQAADQAASRYAHAEAARHYQRALDRLSAVGDLPRAADVQYRLARELYDLNRLADALAAYDAALGTFERLNDANGQARAHQGIGLLHSGRYDMVAAVPHFDAALRLWPGQREDAELGWLLLDAARASFFNGDSARANSLAERALALAERCDDAGLLARTLANVAAERLQRDPRPQASLALLDRAEHVARSAGDWRALTYVYVTRADWPELSGELDQALADRRRAVEAAERSGQVERLAFAYHTVADTCLKMGAWQEGRAAAREGLALDPHRLLKGMAGVALLTWMNGQPQDALSQLAAYAHDARRRRDLQGLSVSLAGFAEMVLQINRPADAETAAREAFELLQVPGGWRPWPGVACGPLAETVVRLATQDAETVLDMAEQMVGTTEQYVARPQLLRARGLWLQQHGELDRAMEALTVSAQVARSQQARIQLGRTLDALAALALQRGDAAVAAQTEAELKQLVDSIGPEVSMLAWARRVGLAADSNTALPGHGRPITGALAMLTRREREVAVLMARGLTNRQIADELIIAEGTAGVHVDHILNKLGFRSRAQVAAWAVEHELLATATD